MSLLTKIKSWFAFTTSKPTARKGKSTAEYSKTFVGAMSGLGSGIPLVGIVWKQPVQKLVDRIRKNLGADTIMATWTQRNTIRDYIIKNHSKYNRIVLIGHSLGATAATHIAEDLEKQNITVDLVIIGDESLDGVGKLKDVAFGSNVKRVVEYHWGLDTVRFHKRFRGEHRFVKVSGGHTASFNKKDTQDDIVGEVIKVMKN